jgi:hypothetical protein
MLNRNQRIDHRNWLVFLLFIILCADSSAQDTISESRPPSDFDSTVTDKSGVETVDDDATPKELSNAQPTIEYEPITEKVFENKELKLPVDI